MIRLSMLGVWGRVGQGARGKDKVKGKGKGKGKGMPDLGLRSQGRGAWFMASRAGVTPSGKREQ